MTLELFVYLVYAQTVLSAVVAMLSFFRFQSRSITARLIGFVFLGSCLANIASWLMIQTGTFRGFINVPYPIYLMVSMVIYSRLYFILLHKKHAGFFIGMASVYLIYALINIFFIQKTASNSYSYFLHSAILLVYCLVYFYVLMQDLPSLYVHHLPMFWFNSALLIFHAGTFFLFSFTAYLVNVLKNNMLVYWSFHNVLSIIEHLIFVIGFYYDLRILKSKTAGSMPVEG